MNGSMAPAGLYNGQLLRPQLRPMNSDFERVVNVVFEPKLIKAVAPGLSRRLATFGFDETMILGDEPRLLNRHPPKFVSIALAPDAGTLADEKGNTLLSQWRDALSGLHYRLRVLTTPKPEQSGQVIF